MAERALRQRNDIGWDVREQAARPASDNLSQPIYVLHCVPVNFESGSAHDFHGDPSAARVQLASAGPQTCFVPSGRLSKSGLVLLEPQEAICAQTPFPDISAQSQQARRARNAYQAQAPMLQLSAQELVERPCDQLILSPLACQRLRRGSDDFQC